MEPDYIFETSWEVCNKVGGIHTVVSTKAKTLNDELSNNYILIGPDVWKDTTENPEFIEDPFLYKSWKIYAQQQGLHIKVGRWKVVSNPVVVLVDFTPFFSQKDTILKKFWELYKLDSISGQWDYIEPMLFGFAAAKVIESFYEYYIYSHEKIIAHFHEWMTGAGVLYLKEKLPQVATIFTTHATVLGRCIAGNNLPLYGEMEKYNPETYANNFNVKAKHSLESLSALHADAFTTVSRITDKECTHFLEKPVDVVTPNGFEDDFVPKDKDYDNKRKQARDKIFNVVEALLNQPISRDAMLLINSGRYEFKNKGIDVFIDAVGELNKQNPQRDVVAIIAVPAGHITPSSELLARIGNPDFEKPLQNQYTTHTLYDPVNDPILHRIKKNQLNNSSQDKVKIIFIPAYLNNHDGVFNLNYFDFLTAFDAGIFPSYYEPWGYTPMECLAFSIPTVTTSVAGFGQWILSSVQGLQGPLQVLERTDDNTVEMTKELTKAIADGVKMSAEQIEDLHKKSYEISRQTLWVNFIQYYKQAFDIALQKAEARFPLYQHKIAKHHTENIKTGWGQQPEWKKIFIKPVMPEALQDLVRLSQNLWWSWDAEATELFYLIDQNFATKYAENPVHMLASLSGNRLEELSQDSFFLSKMHSVASRFDAYMAETQNREGFNVAYFCMEFGLHNTLKIFSGGLGMLAGDYLKEASDSNKNMVGIGLLYRYGYFSQQITKSGEQISEYVTQRFSQLPLKAVLNENGEWQRISIALPGRILYAKIWQCDVGRIPLYLIDTDITENSEADRSITYQLYGGDWENRLKQEMLLGIGGIRFLEAIGIKPDIYHNNEGHSAFNAIERMANLIKNEKKSFADAKEIVRASTLFTTHTPVPAGHDAFHEDMLRAYMAHTAEQLNITWDEFMGLGRFNPDNSGEKFSMSVLATNFSQEVNGVSAIHGRVSREMFAPLYQGYFPEELHIGHVTNGVHFPTWVAKSWEKLYVDAFGKEFLSDQSSDLYWQKIHNVPDQVIWEQHLSQKEKLINFIGEHLQKDLRNRAEDPKLWFSIMERIDKNALIIGFARRFATYKRAYLLFSNLDRLNELVNTPGRPVNFIFAGKAHPQDKAGQDLIKNIIEISKRPEFIGKIIFLENYDMYMAKHLVQGVDIWLNTPTRPLEASGTSGEKAVMNGVLNFSVLDGWWAEGYKKDAGWALSEEQTYENNDFQNALDAETIYQTFEDEIIPAYYDRNKQGFSPKWISYIKNTIAQIAPHFTMKRQLDDYYDKFYTKLYNRSSLLLANNCAKIKELTKWKEHILSNWDGIELLSLKYRDTSSLPLKLGEEYRAEITLLTNKIDKNSIGVEMIVTERNGDVHKLIRVQKMEPEGEQNNGKVTFACQFKVQLAGVYEYAFRIYPKNDLLPHRQDFPLLKWV